jgi:hypothetical protein
MAAMVTKRQVEALIAEIDVYLEAVAVFRAEGREPRWREEFAPAEARPVDPLGRMSK